jgi:glycerophosphoryl diester phosphodiesterase
MMVLAALGAMTALAACSTGEGNPDGSLSDAGADGGVRFVPSIQKMVKGAGPHLAMLIAHRGGAGEAPENTMAAYQYSFGLGVASIEIDTRPTKDGVLVIIHDDTLDRATDCTGEVDQKTRDELKGCTVTAGNITNFTPEQRKIPTLDEVFAWVKDKMLVNIDAKSASLDDLVVKIREYGLTDQVIYQTGSASGCLSLETKYPDIFCLAKIEAITEVDFVKEQLKTNLLQLGDNSLYTNENMEMIHSGGLKTTINVMGTYDLLPTADKLEYLKTGGDMFQTDMPAQWQAALKRYNR